MAKDEHTGRKMAIGTILGGAIGYLTGILTAPKSGKETREDITDKAMDVKEGAEEQLQSAQTELDDLLKNAKSKSLALGSKAREEFNEAVVRAKDAQNKTVHLMKAVKAGQADEPELNKAIKQARLAAKNLGKYFKA